MIDFEENNSPHYVWNKEHLESRLRPLSDFQFDGWCNAYGYDIQGKAQWGKLHIHLVLCKHQTTHNGIFIPLDASNNTEIELRIEGLNSDRVIRYSTLPLVKLFNTGISKDPNDPLQQFLREFKVHSFVQKKSVLTLKINNSLHTPSEILEGWMGLEVG